MKRIAACSAVAAFALLLVSCPLDLRGYVEWLKARDTIIPIDEIMIASAGDFFDMGEPPAFPVPLTFTYSFLMSKYEITHAHFAKFIEDGGYATQSYWTANGWAWRTGVSVTLPEYWTIADFNAPDQPVVGVSWYEAVAYCNWRSIREGFIPAYGADGRLDLHASGYSLPTEAEWEYAAAKGEPGMAERLFAYGDTADPAREVCSDSAPIPTRPAPVGSRGPAGDTPQGLCDMNGNVAEWCSDTTLAPVATTDRYEYVADVFSNSNMVIRSGSWGSIISLTKSAWSGWGFPETQMNLIGFRTVRRQ